MKGLCSALTVAALSSSLYAASSEQLHLHTSPGAFLHVQYTSKAEFVEGLRHHPYSLNALARHFHVSPSEFLRYVDSSLHLAHLTAPERFEVWGLSSNGHIFSTHHRFPKGTPVWETEDGTPILRWVCSNPLAAGIHMVAKAVVVTPPPVVTQPPAPKPTPPQPEPTPVPPQPEPTPVPQPTPPPEPTPVPPQPQPQPVAPTPQPVAPTLEPKPIPPVQALHGTPFSLGIGLTSWRLAGVTCLALYSTAEAKYDPIYLGDRTQFGLYTEVGGLFNNHPSFYYYGGGVEMRSYLLAKNRRETLNPYVDLGYGVYRSQITEANFRNGTLLAPRATVGVEVRDRWFLEASWLDLGKHFGRDLSRLGVDIGYRF